MQLWVISMAAVLTAIIAIEYWQVVVIGFAETCRQFAILMLRLALAVAKRFPDPKERQQAIKETEANIEKAERGELEW